MLGTFRGQDVSALQTVPEPGPERSKAESSSKNGFVRQVAVSSIFRPAADGKKPVVPEKRRFSALTGDLTPCNDSGGALSSDEFTRRRQSWDTRTAAPFGQNLLRKTPRTKTLPPEGTESDSKKDASASASEKSAPQDSGRVSGRFESSKEQGISEIAPQSNCHQSQDPLQNTDNELIGKSGVKRAISKDSIRVHDVNSSSSKSVVLQTSSEHSEESRVKDPDSENKVSKGYHVSKLISNISCNQNTSSVEGTSTKQSFSSFTKSKDSVCEQQSSSVVTNSCDSPSTVVVRRRSNVQKAQTTDPVQKDLSDSSGATKLSSPSLKSHFPQKDTFDAKVDSCQAPGISQPTDTESKVRTRTRVYGLSKSRTAESQPAELQNVDKLPDKQTTGDSGLDSSQKRSRIYGVGKREILNEKLSETSTVKVESSNCVSTTSSAPEIHKTPSVSEGKSGVTRLSSESKTIVTESKTIAASVSSSSSSRVNSIENSQKAKGNKLLNSRGASNEPSAPNPSEPTVIVKVQKSIVNDGSLTRVKPEETANDTATHECVKVATTQKQNPVSVSNTVGAKIVSVDSKSETAARSSDKEASVDQNSSAANKQESQTTESKDTSLLANKIEELPKNVRMARRTSDLIASKIQNIFSKVNVESKEPPKPLPKKSEKVSKSIDEKFPERSSGVINEKLIEPKSVSDVPTRESESAKPKNFVKEAENKSTKTAEIPAVSKESAVQVVKKLPEKVICPQSSKPSSVVRSQTCSGSLEETTKSKAPEASDSSETKDKTVSAKPEIRKTSETTPVTLSDSKSAIISKAVMQPNSTTPVAVKKADIDYKVACTPVASRKTESESKVAASSTDVIKTESETKVVCTPATSKKPKSESKVAASTTPTVKKTEIEFNTATVPASAKKLEIDSKAAAASASAKKSEIVSLATASPTTVKKTESESKTNAVPASIKKVEIESKPSTVPAASKKTESESVSAVIPIAMTKAESGSKATSAPAVIKKTESDSKAALSVPATVTKVESELKSSVIPTSNEISPRSAKPQPVSGVLVKTHESSTVNGPSVTDNQKKVDASESGNKESFNDQNKVESPVATRTSWNQMVSPVSRPVDTVTSLVDGTKSTSSDTNADVSKDSKQFTGISKVEDDDNNECFKVYLRMKNAGDVPSRPDYKRHSSYVMSSASCLDMTVSSSVSKELDSPSASSDSPRPPERKRVSAVRDPSLPPQIPPHSAAILRTGSLKRFEDPKSTPFAVLRSPSHSCLPSYGPHRYSYTEMLSKVCSYGITPSPSASTSSLPGRYSKYSSGSLSQVSELWSDLTQEQSSAAHTSEILEAETTERMRLEKEVQDLQSRFSHVQQKSDKMEMEMMEARVYRSSGVNGDLSDGEEVDGDGSIYKQKYERAVRDMEIMKRRIQQQHEEEVEQNLLNKKAADKKLAEALEDVEEERQVANQWKRKAQKLSSELQDIRLMLEEQMSRNGELEKKQRRFDSELNASQEEIKKERLLREKLVRERDQVLQEKYSLEQELHSTRLDMDMQHEKITQLNRELDELSLSSKGEEEVTQLKRAKQELERKTRDQEEELEELAGQVQMLEQAKLRLEMSLEKLRQEHRRESSVREEEIEELRASFSKKIKNLEAQLETEQEDRHQLVKQKHELERRLIELTDQPPPQDPEIERRLRRDLKRTKALLRDAQSMLEHVRDGQGNKSIIRQLKNQLEDAEFAKCAAIKAKQTSEMELHDLQLQFEEVSRTKNDAESRCLQLSREKSAIQTQLEEMEEELSEVMKKYKAAVAQMSIDQKTISEQTQQITELEVERHALKEQLSEVNTKFEHLAGQSEDAMKVHRLDSKVRELESKLELEQTTRGRLEHQITRLKEQIERLQEECDGLRNKESQAQEGIRRFQRQIRELREDYAALQQKEADAYRKQHELETALENAESDLKVTKNDLRLACQRIEELKNALEDDLDSGTDVPDDSGSDSDSSLDMSVLRHSLTPIQRCDSASSDLSFGGRRSTTPSMGYEFSAMCSRGDAQTEVNGFSHIEESKLSPGSSCGQENLDV